MSLIDRAQEGSRADRFERQAAKRPKNAAIAHNLVRALDAKLLYASKTRSRRVDQLLLDHRHDHQAWHRMVTRKRLPQQESRITALEAARALLIESGPQAVTLKAVAARMGRTHANLLHHFGSAAQLQRELARHLGDVICGTIAEAVLANRAGLASARHVVDLTFDAFGREGGGKLASWMALNGNDDALNPIIEAIHDMVDELDASGAGVRREVTLTLVLLALGDAQMGCALANSLGLPTSTARDMAERVLNDAAERARSMQMG
jgi:AcrR family transcriptional regulator